jgi:hypothetical protein
LYFLAWHPKRKRKLTLIFYANEQIEIGVGLTAFGLFFMLMGVMMFFDGGLLAIGNVSIFFFIRTGRVDG